MEKTSAIEKFKFYLDFLEESQIQDLGNRKNKSNINRSDDG